MITATEWAALVGDPGAPGHATYGIDAQAQVEKSGIGVFRYVLRADMPRLRTPAAQPAERANGLWQHTCFEAFIQPFGAAGYYELNFAPSRQWAIYCFSAYREGMSSPEIGAPPQILVRRFADRLEVDAAVRLHELIGLGGARRLKVGLSAIVEKEDGTLSYWALKHAPGKADFHCPDGFVLEFELEMETASLL